MAVSCPEVMYGAYYPYLYGRAGPSRPFYQYERFNQDLYSTSGVPLTSGGSASGSSHSPCSPILTPSTIPPNVSQTATTTVPTIPLTALQRHIAKEEDLGITRSDTDVGPLSGGHNESSCSSGPESPHHIGGGNHPEQHTPARAQYVSATCVVFTHYSGDASSVVDEHFSRALNFSNKESKESSPMTARNFPPSFWNSNYIHPTPAPTHAQMTDLYPTDGGYSTDPWVPHAAHYGSYAHAAHAHAAHAHAYHHHNMAQYGSLLRLPQQYGHSSRLHHDQQTAHALESAAYSSYPTMAGLEAQVQESSKDLYWF